MLETERLELHPLKVDELKLWIENLPKLEKLLSCSYKAEPLEGIFLEIVKGQLEITKLHPNEYMWHSFWLLIRKSDRVVVGSADFKDIPNVDGEVEIGYGLGIQFEKQGYMTEAVQAMIKWAMGQEGVKHIIAETDLDGFASGRILQKCGFKEIARNQTIWWRL